MQEETNQQVKVIDGENQQLFSCNVEQIDLAYEFAKEMEELGIEVFIKSPSLPETLAQSLGARSDHLKIIRESMDEEISAHITPNSCCAPNPNETRNE